MKMRRLSPLIPPPIAYWPTPDAPELERVTVLLAVGPTGPPRPQAGGMIEVLTQLSDHADTPR
jgi:hypothetical protein